MNIIEKYLMQNQNNPNLSSKWNIYNQNKFFPFATYVFEPQEKEIKINQDQDTDFYTTTRDKMLQQLMDEIYGSDSSQPYTPSYESEAEVPTAPKPPSIKKKVTYNTSESYTGNKRNIVQQIKTFATLHQLPELLVNALIGIFDAESNLNYRAINTEEQELYPTYYGAGLYQLSNSRKIDFANWYTEKYGEAAPSIENTPLEIQFEFALHEIENRPALIQAIKNAKTLEEMTTVLYLGFMNGSKNYLATEEELIQIYNPARAKLGQTYNYAEELQDRIHRAYKAANTK